MFWLIAIHIVLAHTYSYESLQFVYANQIGNKIFETEPMVWLICLPNYVTLWSGCGGLCRAEVKNCYYRTNTCIEGNHQRCASPMQQWSDLPHSEGNFTQWDSLHAHWNKQISMMPRRHILMTLVIRWLHQVKMSVSPVCWFMAKYLSN